MSNPNKEEFLQVAYNKVMTQENPEPHFTSKLGFSFIKEFKTPLKEYLPNSENFVKVADKSNKTVYALARCFAR